MSKPKKKESLLLLTTRELVSLKEVLEFTSHFFRDGTVGETANKLLAKVKKHCPKPPELPDPFDIDWKGGAQ